MYGATRTTGRSRAIVHRCNRPESRLSARDAQVRWNTSRSLWAREPMSVCIRTFPETKSPVARGGRGGSSFVNVPRTNQEASSFVKSYRRSARKPAPGCRTRLTLIYDAAGFRAGPGGPAARECRPASARPRGAVSAFRSGRRADLPALAAQRPEMEPVTDRTCTWTDGSGRRNVARCSWNPPRNSGLHTFRRRRAPCRLRAGSVRAWGGTGAVGLWRSAR